MKPRVPPAPSTPPHLLLFGPAPTAEQEFHDLLQWLQTHSNGPSRFAWERCPVESLRERLAGPPAALAVVLQSWPNEVAPEDVAAALGEWPVCRWICCYGSWCESAGRTRNIWPRAVRIPASRALERLQHELDVLRGVRSPLAPTASREEQFAWDYLDADDVLNAPALPIHLAIAHPPLAETIADLLRNAGADVHDTPSPAAEPGLILWDIDPLLGAVRERDLARLRAALAEIAGENGAHRVVALTGFADGELIATLTRLNVPAVVSKLAGEPALFQALHTVATRAAAS